MLRSTTRIRTSHVGRLPPPKGWDEMPARLANAEITDPATIARQVVPAIAETVRRQAEIGIDCVGDGEYWTARSFAHYQAHFTGLEVRPLKPGEPPTTRHSTRERDEFPDFYGDCDRAGTLFLVPGEKPTPPITERVVARGPIASKGPAAIRRQIDAFKAAIAASGAVVEAGFILQIDDPGLPDWWDMLKPEPSVAEYRRFARLRIDAVNRALSGIPEDRVRYHLCWGSWHGPHTHDLPLEHIIDLILEVKAQTYSFEAANVRHEHEWRLWQQAKIPDGKMLMPGVVSHATNLVEHPQLVADRIRRFVDIVGRENVIAGTDCGLGGRVHADLVWAKLKTLAEGARLASQAAWG